MIKRRWAIALIYVLFIYITLAYVRYPVTYLRSMGILRLSLSLFYIAAIGFIWLAFFRRSKVWWQHLLLMVTMLSYIPFSKLARTPEEQIHFFQYGLVGILFARALGENKPLGVKILAIALLLGGLAGVVDELIQGALPTRHYDVRDIYLNFLSVFLGLLIFCVFRLPMVFAAKTTPLPHDR